MTPIQPATQRNNNARFLPQAGIPGLSFWIAIGLLLAPGVAPARTASPGFEQLQRALEANGFVIRLELPPVRGAYGLLEANTKTIWINPVVFELGNAEATLIHESVHAAQLCAGRGELQELGLDLPPPPLTRRYFLRYSHLRRQLEAEAYTITAQPNAFDLVLELLQERCQN